MSVESHPLAGTWHSLEETLFVVEYVVTGMTDGFLVDAIDSYDGEQAEVSKVGWNEEKQELNFSCYWASSGRYSKCKFLLFSQDKVEFTYTYTDHEILERKPG